MKTVSIAVPESTWDTVEKLARARQMGPDRLVLALVETYTGQAAVKSPPPQERRAALEKIWADIDACNVEVGEHPSRARTYDHRRFHRH